MVVILLGNRDDCVCGGRACMHSVDLGYASVELWIFHLDCGECAYEVYIGHRPLPGWDTVQTVSL